MYNSSVGMHQQHMFHAHMQAFGQAAQAAMAYGVRQQPHWPQMPMWGEFF